jgi:hypothetical protein
MVVPDRHKRRALFHKRFRDTKKGMVMSAVLRKSKFLIFYLLLALLVTHDGTAGSYFDGITRLTVGYDFKEGSTYPYLIVVSFALVVFGIYEITNALHRFHDIEDFITIRCDGRKEYFLYLRRIAQCAVIMTLQKLLTDVIIISLDGSACQADYLTIIKYEILFAGTLIIIGCLIETLIALKINNVVVYFISIIGALIFHITGLYFPKAGIAVSTVPVLIFDCFIFILLIRIIETAIATTILYQTIKKRIVFRY